MATIEGSGDRAIDRTAVVAAYTPEMLTVRDQLRKLADDLKNTMTAQDATGNLPQGAEVRHYEAAGVTQIAFGTFPENFTEALAAHRARRLLQQAGMDSGSTDFATATFNNAPPAADDDPLVLLEDTPRLKVEWNKSEGNQTRHDTVSIFDDGYVEHSTETVAIEMRHPEGTDEALREYIKPTERREVEVTPLTIRPAELSDIAAAHSNLHEMGSRYGIVA